MNLTIAYITSRREPKIQWFLDSLFLQTKQRLKIIIVDSFCDTKPIDYSSPFELQITLPKPTVWQGKYRLTKEDWWAKSNAMNTAICLCQTDFIAFVDDRCVLSPGWLNCVRDAMGSQYAVCGSYEKRSGMKVEHGVIVDPGECLGVDTRSQNGLQRTWDWYGGSCALPLEWCLQVNGFDEKMCDSLGSEDSMFGITLKNSGYQMYYDSNMRIIEDRNPFEIEGALKRADKNPHLGQKAKSWDIVRAFHGKKTSQNDFDIRNMRKRVLSGEPFPPPVGAAFDWYDGQPLSEMT